MSEMNEMARYVAHENEVVRIAQIIVNAGCKPYASAEALIAAGLIAPPATTTTASEDR